MIKKYNSKKIYMHFQIPFIKRIFFLPSAISMYLKVKNIVHIKSPVNELKIWNLQ